MCHASKAKPGRDLRRPGTSSGENLAEVGRGNTQGRAVVIDVIERVECIQTQFQPDQLGEAENLTQRRIYYPVARTADQAWIGVAGTKGRVGYRGCRHARKL